MQDHTQKLLDTFASLSTPSEWVISPDGTRVAFTQAVNDVSQIFAMSISGSFPRRLTTTLADCHEPQWSPDSKQIVFTSDDALWIMDANGAKSRKLCEHPSGHAEPQWSPDGKRIAFYSRRRGWDHIWTVGVETSALRQILKGDWDADDVAWSPDSKWIAYCSIREPDLMTRGVYLIPSDGGDEILVSSRGCWSGAPHFSPDGKTLAYLSDHDGWFQIYLHDLSGSSSHTLPSDGMRAAAATKQITHGEFEIGGPYFYNVDPHGGPVYSPDGKRLAFIQHREGNFDLWVADAIPPTPLTKGGVTHHHADSESSDFQSSTRDDARGGIGAARRVSTLDGHHRIIGWLPDSKRLVAQFDNPANPPGLWIFSVDGKSEQMVDSCAGELNSDTIIFPTWVTYKSRDGLDIYAAMYRPRSPLRESSPYAGANTAESSIARDDSGTPFPGGAKEELDRAPAVVFLHGGPNFEFANYFYPLPQLLAQEGYVVFAPNFRGSTGFGTQFRHANFNEWGHNDAFDVIDGVEWLKKQDYIDPDRVAVVGPSYGGYLTLCVVTIAPEIFCAGVDMYGDS